MIEPRSQPPTTDNVNLILDFVHRDLLNRRGPVQLNDNEDLLLSGYIDSLGVMRLVAFLESTFEISVPPEDVTIENFQNGRSIADYVARHVNQKAEA